MVKNSEGYEDLKTLHEIEQDQIHYAINKESETKPHNNSDREED